MLVTFDSFGGFQDFYCSEASDEVRKVVTESPLAPALRDRLNDVAGPVRLNDLATLSAAANLPECLPPPGAFLGIPIRCHDSHVGNIYLVDKEGGAQFTDEDEAVAAVLAAQAASIIGKSSGYDQKSQVNNDLETLMENCPVAVSVFDSRLGGVSYMNQECRRIIGALGLAPEELGNAYLTLKITRPEGRVYALSELPGTRALLNGETVVAEEVVVHRPDGTTITTLVNCLPIFSGSGEVLSVLMVCLDMTPLEKQELRRAEFLEMVSEELRTPLISIKGSVAALRNPNEPTSWAEQLQLLRIIDQQADLMRSQINSLVELTQINTGTLSVVAEPADVAGLIEWACGQYLSEHAAITIKTDIEDGLAAVLADRRRIGEVLHHFLRQAAKHSGESHPVMVSAARDDIHVAISVTAEGPVAPPDLISLPVNSYDDPQFFDQVSQAYIKAAELFSQGEGMAIAFCRGVVEAHGGRLTTEVDEDGGRLTLTFTLPTVEDEVVHQITDASAFPDETPREPAQPTRILVAIEDRRMLTTVRTILHDAGYSSVDTPDLDEIEELVWSERPQLMVLDIAGREDESFRVLRSAANPMNLPAIVLCERDDEEYVVRAFEMGVDGYMVKPFSPSEMIARIKATLRRMNVGGEPVGNRTMQLGDILIDFDERTVNRSGRSVQLTVTEYKLLIELSLSAGRVLTQDELLHRVWGPEYAGEQQILRSYIKSLRRKLGDNARKPTHIFTEHGVGYRMARPVHAANPSDLRV